MLLLLLLLHRTLHLSNLRSSPPLTPSYPFLSLPLPPPLIPWQVDHIKTLTTGRVMFAFTKIGTVGLCLLGPLYILIGCLLTTGTVMFAFTHLPIYQNRYLRRGPAGRDVYSLLPRPAFGDRPDQGDNKQPINIYNGPIKYKPTCSMRRTKVTFLSYSHTLILSYSHTLILSYSNTLIL